MTKEIEITIDEEGNIKLNLNGFDGKNCLELTKDLEKKLGIVRERKKKPEYNRRATINTTEENRNRRGR